MTKLTFPQVSCDIKKAAHIYAELRRTRPSTKTDLKNYVKVFLGIDVPHKKICPEHNSPMDYLWHSFSADFSNYSNRHSERNDPLALSPAEGEESGRRKANADCIIWANRAGGKTELAAVVTLLDCIFKPNCQVRILGGSGEQAGRMY